jgi:Cdc6-like AAA superfamily ATPase
MADYGFAELLPSHHLSMSDGTLHRLPITIMALDHDLLILHDRADLENAFRIAAALRERSIDSDVDELPDASTAFPGRPEGSPFSVVVRYPVAILLCSHARSDWNLVSFSDPSTHLIVADLTGGALDTLPLGVREIVPMRDLDSGIAQLAFLIETILDLGGDKQGDGEPQQQTTPPPQPKATKSNPRRVSQPKKDAAPEPEMEATASQDAPPRNATGASSGSIAIDLPPDPGTGAPDAAPETVQAVEPDTAANGPRVGSQTGAGNDRVAKTDSLGFHHYVQAFADLIESPHTRPPLTIGVYGSWGMGKSFLLEHVIARLRENQTARAAAAERQRARSATAAEPDDARKPDVYTVSFNAWEYSAAEVIWPGLVRKIMDTLEREVSGGKTRIKRSKINRNFTRRLKERAPQVVGGAVVVTILMAAVLASVGFSIREAVLTFSVVGLAGLAKVVVETLNAPLGQWVTALFQDTDYGKQIGHMAEIRADLELLENLLSRENGRMVVVIDDLDRCEPEKAVEMLQAINLLLNFDSFIVVMGIDARIVTRAIESHYKDMLGAAGASGYEYLDKIVQIPFRIPQSEPATIVAFLKAQLAAPAVGLSRSAAASPGGGAGSAPGTETAEADQQPIGGSEPMTPSPPRRWNDRNEVRSRPSPRDSTPAPAAPEAEPQPVVAPPVAFSDEEVAAFEEAAEFLKPNPRHIKRLVNVYRLVRTLAHLRSEETLLRNPAATLRWLITSGQWPFATHAMLLHFSDMEERGEKLPEGDPLPVLLEHIRPILNSENASQLDHDHDVLDALLRSGYGAASSEELKVIRRYTVNFNPAVERELLLSMLQQTREAREKEAAAKEKAAARERDARPKRPRPTRSGKPAAMANAGSPIAPEPPEAQKPTGRVPAPVIAPTVQGAPAAAGPA